MPALKGLATAQAEVSHWLESQYNALWERPLEYSIFNAIAAADMDALHLALGMRVHDVTSQVCPSNALPSGRIEGAQAAADAPTPCMNRNIVVHAGTETQLLAMRILEDVCRAVRKGCPDHRCLVWVLGASFKGCHLLTSAILGRMWPAGKPSCGLLAVPWAWTPGISRVVKTLTSTIFLRILR